MGAIPSAPLPTGRRVIRQFRGWRQRSYGRAVLPRARSWKRAKSSVGCDPQPPFGGAARALHRPYGNTPAVFAGRLPYGHTTDRRKTLPPRWTLRRCFPIRSRPLRTASSDRAVGKGAICPAWRREPLTPRSRREPRSHPPIYSEPEGMAFIKRQGCRYLSSSARMTVRRRPVTCNPRSTGS